MTDRELELLTQLRDGDDKSAYALLKRMNAESAETDVYYGLFDEFAALTKGRNSYVRTRGFVLCCAQARWDENGKLAGVLPTMLAQLRDEKPTAVRQCIKALHEAALYRRELDEIILKGIGDIEPEKFGDSMAPLIAKDIKALQKMIE